MYVLGVNPGVYKTNHDSSACLLKDGKIVAFSAQERFDRKKHSNAFPQDAINWCLNFAGIKPEQVDCVAVNWKPEIFLTSTLSHPTKVFNKHNAYNRLLNIRLYMSLKSGIRRLESQFKNKVVCVEHHMSHAASSYYVSGFKKANVLTMDGRGESESSVGFVGDEDKLTKLWSRSFFENHSFGLCYTLLTSLIGLGRFGEGKTMGLAPYGKPTQDFSNILSYKGSHNNSLADYSKISRFKKYRNGKNEELQQIHKDLAASLQQGLEETILGLVGELKDQTGSDILCLAGGTTLNCKTNGLIIERGLAKNIYIQPAASDDGGALGAATWAHINHMGAKFTDTMPHAYWGPEFSNEEILEELKKSGLSYDFYGDISGVAAELLNKGKIVGWFQGRMEIGPRALGNRSILANPSIQGISDKVNEVKTREKWRPLAPSMLRRAMKEYFDFDIDSPFMILSFSVKPEKRKEIAGVVHVDGSTRPQSVTTEINPRYYKLIKNFESLSGIPVVINTSFNDHTEPIVCTPAQAIRTFRATKMDMLAIGNYLVKKI